ncbi:hypothetical protein PAT3040_02978 [Paenibacillus agaridevorans]|uniref:Uncharacterized protein n=1 Tax=Paenibacillus agaridevorans TaxID=171404 RepID=A0A2R5EP89_9BACL|nr:hypothetical protein PAT3040_02978 [Paenibacillus agaridevorans]
MKETAKKGKRLVGLKGLNLTLQQDLSQNMNLKPRTLDGKWGSHVQSHGR